MTVINGQDGVGEIIFGTQGPDVINGRGGNDWIRAWGITGDVTNPDPSVANHIADQLDTVYGDTGDDTLEGGGGDDWIYGGEGADRIIGGTGIDHLVGGPGADVFQYGRLAGPHSASDAYVGPGTREEILDFTRGEDLLDFSGYQNPNDPGYLFVGTDPLVPSSKLTIGWTIGASSTVVSWAAPTTLAGRVGQFMGATGEIRLEGVTALNTRDFGIEGPGMGGPPPAASPTPPAFADEAQAKASRLYDTCFGRLPDLEGLRFWQSALNNGYTLDAIADLFITAPEFRETYGPLNNGGFVSQLYLNVLDRPGEPEGVAFWTGNLDAGHADRSDIVVGFSESQEHVVKVVAGDWLLG